MNRDRDRFVADVLHSGDTGLGASVVRGLLAPLALLHQIGLALYLLPYRTGLRQRFRLPVPVIAIGNLSSGGTGKTPMTVLVTSSLQAQGKKVVVLSRGHGGAHEAGRVPRVVSDGIRILLSPQEAGDEPVLLAQRLSGVPIVVCRDRRKSGRFAVDTFAPDVLVCDDALQYWQLHRDLDIVLLDAQSPFDNGYVLPRGLLREPPAHLARAGIIVLTRADRVNADDLAKTVADVQHFTPAPIFTAIHAPLGWVRAGDTAVLPLSAFAGKRVAAFSGIADANAFVQSVRQTGAEITYSDDFGDHHAYAPEEITRLATAPTHVVVTTEKDLVKVAPLWPANAPPLYALRIGMRVQNEAEFLYRVGSAIPLSS